jgi:predicted phage gp36 major capsid-like protein
MNLSENPTKEELKALIARSDDNEGDHILWVDRDGDVYCAMRAIAPVVDTKGLTWKHFGSARILTTIKRIIDGPRKEGGKTVKGS